MQPFWGNDCTLFTLSLLGHAELMNGGPLEGVARGSEGQQMALNTIDPHWLDQCPSMVIVFSLSQGPTNCKTSFPVYAHGAGNYTWWKRIIPIIEKLFIHSRVVFHLKAFIENKIIVILYNLHTRTHMRRLWGALLIKKTSGVWIFTFK